ncbi:hypothetical protein MP638_007348, partial [Amoeboaphelidium occidentale]
PETGTLTPRSGKSSIVQVIFNKISPAETFFLDTPATAATTKEFTHTNSLIKFDIVDVPGQVDFFNDPTFDSESLLKGISSVLFVIDSQDDYMDALSKLFMTIVKGYNYNPRINYEVFIHKVDGLSDDHKIETQRDIQQRIIDELTDSGLDPLISFHLTSIYDHSIFESFSKVIQKLTPELPALENMLNILCSNSGIEKVFLFDVFCKVYLATDSSPVDMQSYELMSDVVDVLVDVSLIYAYESAEKVPFDSRSQAVIRLNNGYVLFLEQMSTTLALVCLLRGDQFQERRSWIEFNFSKFKENLSKMYS